MMRRWVVALVAVGVAFAADPNASREPIPPVELTKQALDAPPKKSRTRFKALRRANPLCLLQRFDAATTDLALRFSSWKTDLPPEGPLDPGQAARGPSVTGSAPALSR